MAFVPRVEAYLGLGSRYSYLASTQLDRIAAATGAEIDWIPVTSEDLFADGRNPFRGEPVSRQYGSDYRKADAEAWAAYYDVPFREPRGRITFDPQLLVRAALAAGAGEVRVAMMKRLFQAVFVDDRKKIDALDCVSFAVDVGLDPRAYHRALGDPMVEAERFAIIARATARGVFGVPYFIVGTRAFFGNDRVTLLAHHLLSIAKV